MSAARACACCGIALSPRVQGTRCRSHQSWLPTPEAALVDHWETRFDDDPWAMEIARRGGATLSIVADALAITRERVRQIEAAALRKLIPRLALVGIGRDDIARVLAERPGVPYADAPSMPRDADARERQRAQKRAAMARVRAQERGGEVLERLPEGAWSEHGQRVERALLAVDALLGFARGDALSRALDALPDLPEAATQEAAE